MIIGTDEHIRMRIKWIKQSIRTAAQGAWWKVDALHHPDAAKKLVAESIKKYGLTEKAVEEAYFYGRQHGRLTMAKEMMAIVGEEGEE